MTPMDALLQHQQLCDELHEFALAENSFLQQHRRAPDAPLLERKRSLLTRLDETLAALRGVSGAGPRTTDFRAALEKTRSRILQVLQLDRENEQLLLRYSLSARPAATAAPAATPSMLQKIYERHAQDR